MSLLKSIIGSGKKQIVTSGDNQTPAYSIATAGSMSGWWSHFTSDRYSGAYPNVRAIADEYMQVMPFAIDNNGKPVQDHYITNVLFHPNTIDSGPMFEKKIAVSTLVNPKTYLLAWHIEDGQIIPGGDFRGGDQIAGFTFLEHPQVIRTNGRSTYKTDGGVFNDLEVLVLPGDVNPHDLYAGYSPSEAARRWLTLDDYIADYQSGYFENGAIPAGQFIISANSQQEYDDIVDTLQEKHRGAGKNGNVTYSPRIVSEGGQLGASQVEWVPFAQSLRDIDFNAVFEQANNRIDMAYGVSRFIKAVDDSPNYATAQVSEANFAKRAVRPRLVQNYSNLNQEINRITGGIGVALNFKYDIPAVADDEKVRAETKLTEGEVIGTYLQLGYSLGSIVDAFQFSQSYKLLTLGSDTPTIENDKPEVDNGDEVANAPDPTVVDSSIGSKAVTDYAPKNPWLNSFQKQTDQIEKIATDFITKQANRAIDSLNVKDITVDDSIDNAELAEFIASMLSVSVQIALEQGQLQRSIAEKVLDDFGVNLDNVTPYTVSDDLKVQYRTYLQNVGLSYATDTQTAIRQILADANEQGIPAQDVRSALKNLPEIDSYRAKRLGVTETNRTLASGSLDSMKNIQSQTGVVLAKRWNSTIDDKTSEICRELNGKIIGLEETYYNVGQDIGGVVNNFVDVDNPPAHPNCRSFLTYEVLSVPAQKAASSDAIYDKETGRYIGHKTNGHVFIKAFKSSQDTLAIPAIIEQATKPIEG